MAEEAPAIKERLTQYLKTKGIRMAKLERLAGLSNGYLRNSNGAIGAPKLRDILLACGDLDANWLLTGIGEMLKRQPGGDSLTMTGDRAKAVQKGHMIVIESGNLDLANLDSIDINGLPDEVAKMITQFRLLKNELGASNNELVESRKRNETLQKQVDELREKYSSAQEELLDIYRKMSGK